MQQTLSQVVTSLLTIVGVLAARSWISWLLALIALVIRARLDLSCCQDRQACAAAVRQAMVDYRRINAHVEENFTGHSLVRAFGRTEDSMAVFAEQNDKLYQASFRAQSSARDIQPAMMFVGNLNYVLVAVVGCAAGGVRRPVARRRAWRSSSTRGSSASRDPWLRAMANLLQSGVASAERVFALLDRRRAGARSRHARAPTACTRERAIR